MLVHDLGLSSQPPPLNRPSLPCLSVLLLRVGRSHIRPPMSRTPCRMVLGRIDHGILPSPLTLPLQHSIFNPLAFAWSPKFRPECLAAYMYACCLFCATVNISIRIELFLYLTVSLFPLCLVLIRTTPSTCRRPSLRAPQYHHIICMTLRPSRMLWANCLS